MTVQPIALSARRAWRDKWLVFSALGLLGYYRLALSLRGFGDPRKNCRAICSGPEASPALALRVKWSIDTAARLVPRATCLVQATAGQRLLAWKGRTSTIVVGVREGDKRSFEAHAWLVSGEQIVLGGSALELDQFVPIVGISG